MKKLLNIAFLILSTGFLISINAQIPTDDLVAYYPFNGNANDESSNSNDGTVGGAVLTVDRFGNVNRAFDFDGVDDYISVEDHPSIRVGKSELPSFTISVWINISGWQSRSHVLTKRHNVYDAPYNSYGIHVSSEYLNYGTTPYWEASSYHGVIKGTHFAEKSRWVHLVELYDGDSLYLFVDTKQECSGKATGSIGYTNMDLLIGAAALLPNQFMMGKIDDIRIYDRALTTNEIKALFDESDPASVISYNEKVNFNLYPNPANDHVTIDLGDNFKSEEYTVDIYNSLGQHVFNGSLDRQRYNVDLYTLSGKGIYIVKLNDKSNSTVGSRKIVIQ